MPFRTRAMETSKTSMPEEKQAANHGGSAQHCCYSLLEAGDSACLTCGRPGGHSGRQNMAAGGMAVRLGGCLQAAAGLPPPMHAHLLTTLHATLTTIYPPSQTANIIPREDSSGGETAGATWAGALKHAFKLATRGRLLGLPLRA